MDQNFDSLTTIKELKKSVLEQEKHREDGFVIIVLNLSISKASVGHSIQGVFLVIVG